MAEPIPITDPDWRRAVDQALISEGELLALVMYENAGGARDWFVIHDQADLIQALAKVGVTSAIGSSDAISLLATHEFPYREDDLDAAHRAAREVVSRSWVIVAYKRADDPKLHDVEAFGAGEDNELDDWFARPHAGRFFIGEDPYVVQRGLWPDGPEFFAYGVRPDGTVRPGAY